MQFTTFKFPTFNPRPDAVQVVIGSVTVSLTLFWLWGA